jgi:hypothetical protein
MIWPNQIILSTKTEMLFDFYLMKLASNGDMDGIKTVIRSTWYTFDRGLMAISIALNKGNNEIVYEMLSIPGAWDHYVDSQFSPFVILDELKEGVDEYKRYNVHQKMIH